MPVPAARRASDSGFPVRSEKKYRVPALFTQPRRGWNVTPAVPFRLVLVHDDLALGLEAWPGIIIYWIMNLLDGIIIMIAQAASQTDWLSGRRPS